MVIEQDAILSRREVEDAITAEALHAVGGRSQAEHERVAASAAAKPVIACTAIQRVVAGPTEQHVVAVAAGKGDVRCTRPLVSNPQHVTADDEIAGVQIGQREIFQDDDVWVMRNKVRRQRNRDIVAGLPRRSKHLRELYRGEFG